MLEDELAAIGRRRARKKAALEESTEEARNAARRAYDEGMSEAKIARLLQVDRMTVRAWLGKNRPAGPA